MSDCQKAFEKWVSEDYKYDGRLRKIEGGDYLIMTTNLKWKTWKAAWEAKQ